LDLRYNIFISYAGEDNNLAQLLYDSLGRIVQFSPYKAENYLSFQEGFKQRIEAAIIDSFFMIVLLTEKGKESQFVNQELGYALAVKFYNKAVVKAKLDPNRDVPIIIPVSQKGIVLKGFITKDSDDLLFLENYASLEDLVAHITANLRYSIGAEKSKILKIKVTCPECHDKEGLPLNYESYLPQVDFIWNLIKDEQPLEYVCPKCSRVTSLDPRTYLPLKFSQPKAGNSDVKFL
jgi:hypothetical protein